MTTILTYGSFDLFHIGHVRLLERAAVLGDRLIVGVSSDKFNAIKGKRSIMPYESRAEIVAALRCVDFVLPEHDWAQKREDIGRLGADILVMGDDWAGKFDDLNDVCRLVYLPRTSGVSTTELKNLLQAFKGEKIAQLQDGLRSLQSIVAQLEV
jgi:glycerol-3-phosphate cytidylyltransferase